MAARGEGGDSAGFLKRKGPTIAPERLALVERMYLEGKGRPRITSAVCERYGITTRQARNYIAIIEKRLAALPKPPPEATFQRVEAMLLEAYELARNGVQRISVSQGAGAGSRVEEFPQPNAGVMANVAERLGVLYGVGGKEQERAPASVVIELPASLARPREG